MLGPCWIMLKCFVLVFEGFKQVICQRGHVKENVLKVEAYEAIKVKHHVMEVFRSQM